MKPVNFDCAIWIAMEAISPKWTVHIILELITAGEDSLSYSELQTLIPKINPRMLAMRLKSLIENNLVEKILENPDTPKKIRYKLTDGGKELVRIIRQIRRWSINNLHVNDRCMNNSCRHAIEIDRFIRENPEVEPDHIFEPLL